MDEMWGQEVVKLRAENAERGQLFDEGNYAMFIHWGLYSQLANKVDGQTYYGIGEWIMHDRMAGIENETYKELAGTFNPVNFDAQAIAQLAKDAGMKYVVITSKHHDGFAMYDSDSSDFNIVDATPWAKDPMHELADACRELGLGFGFYYSHNQDWTTPGAKGGPKNADGSVATFKDYFYAKCLPQVEEITSQYGPIEIVWFDTPGNMPKQYVEELIEVVHKNQPNALVAGRAGHGLGDYQCLGDMEVPLRNVAGMWESVDTTNDSWAFAWYDENWKSPTEILKRVIGTVARGGTYMLNIGPRGDGSVPERAAHSLRVSGEWIQSYPQAVYGVDASPWEHALPWGDVTVREDRLFLTVFDWPRSGTLYLPGLKTKVKSARLLNGTASTELEFDTLNGWTCFELPALAPEALASVVEVELEGAPVADPTWGLDPELPTRIEAEFATASGAKLSKERWMEKFGEWKHVKQVSDWNQGKGVATWTVDVLVPGDYLVDLTYTGEGRLVWQVEVEGGERIRNQLSASSIYHAQPVGLLNFPKEGRYQVNVSCLEDAAKSASLSTITFRRAE
nr:MULTISPECIES: alpha-L-fucosidase [unclassified Lentimonas]